MCGHLVKHQRCISIGFICCLFKKGALLNFLVVKDSKVVSIIHAKPSHDIQVPLSSLVEVRSSFEEPICNSTPSIVTAFITFSQINYLDGLVSCVSTLCSSNIAIFIWPRKFIHSCAFQINLHNPFNFNCRLSFCHPYI